MYEEIFLVVEGRGTTEVWQDGDAKKHVFEWQRGSMFSIPMNAWHRLVNATSGGALLLAGTTAPNVLNMINNVDAVFNNPFVFRDRFDGADDFFKAKDDIEPDPVRGLAMRRTNFIPDAVNCDLPLDNRRSVGWRRVEPFMTNNQFYFWIGQHEQGRYSKAHAHTSAAILICLKGKGYTYSWPERCGVTPWKDGHADEVRRLDYEPVGMVTAAPGGARWFHQHFGVGRRPVPADGLVRPAQPGPRSRRARREAHRLHRHRHQSGRHGDPVLDGRPVHPRGIRGDAQGQRRAEPHGSRLVRQAGRRGSSTPRPSSSQVASEREDSKSAGACSSAASGAASRSKTRSFCSASASTSARRRRIWCSRGCCWSGSTIATSSRRREIVHESDVLLTPYADDLTIDAAALGAFIERQYEAGADLARAHRHRAR